MVQIPKVVAVLSCGLLLSLGPSIAVLAQDMKAGQSEEKGGQVGQQDMTSQKQFHYIRGNVVRVEYGSYVVKQKDGTEVTLVTDNRTQMMGQVKKGDRIEAKLNEKNRVLLISPMN
jgi:hypothetical protein